MPLPPNSRLGSYEVIELLGEGGMGEVYRARDSKLDRSVALKILPEIFATDADRLARFEREAKVLASLNHPNIAHVYDAGKIGADAYLAMELVPGEDLSTHIAHGPMPLAHVLPIAKQIAAALEAAHDQGIIHRDLKPANIKLREDGTVKVLDFGLAKAFAADAESAAQQVSNSPTLTARSTQLGMILGTAAYMSPEQAKGRAVDRRADVWAFGAVCFEMLSGKRAFEGDDVSEVLAAVLKTEPDWKALPDLPAPVERLLRRCLEKDPKKRLRDIAEGMLQIEDALATPSDVADTTQASSGRRRLLPIAVTAIVAALATLGVSRWMSPAPPPASTFHFTIEPRESTPLSISPRTKDVAISPDGQVVVALTAKPPEPPAVMIRHLDRAETSLLSGSEASTSPFFSPDGRWIGMVGVNGEILKKVPSTGGSPTVITTISGTIAGATWLDDGTIVYGTAGGPLFRVPEGGGKAEAVTALDKAKQESDHIWPTAIPGTSLVLFITNTQNNTPITSAKQASAMLAVVDLRDGRIARLGISGGQPVYLDPGQILYVSPDGTLRAVSFDVKTMSAGTSSDVLLNSVSLKSSGAASFDVSSKGHIVFVPGGLTSSAARTIVWVDRAGKETLIPAPVRNYFYVRLSPDQKYLSLDSRDQEEDVWIWELGRNNISRVTDKPGSDQYGLWARNSERVIFSSQAAGHQEIFSQRIDGVGQPEQHTDTKADDLTPFPNAVTRDSKQVIFRSSVAGKNDLFVVDLDSRKYRRLLATEHDERNAALSPDDKFMAFESDLSGKREIYVRPYPDVDRRQWKVSSDGGTKPVWAPRGNEIFYLSATYELMSVPVAVAGEGLELGKPVALFPAAGYYFGGQGRNYDVSNDSKRFVLVKNPPARNDLSSIQIILNWAEEVRRKLK